MHWIIQTGTSPVYTIQHGGKPPRFSLRSVKLAKNLGCYVLQKPITYEIMEQWLTSVEDKNRVALETS
jgi:hypothetical protein